MNLERTKDVILLARFLLVYAREWPQAEWGDVTVTEAIEAYSRILEYDTALLNSLAKSKGESNENNSINSSYDGFK